MDCSMPGFPVLHYLPEFAQTHVYWVVDAIQISHPLSSPSPPAFNLSKHQGLFQWVVSSHQYWSFSFSIRTPNVQGWFPLGLPDLISLLSKQHSGVFSIIIIWKYKFLDTQPSSWSNSHTCTWLLDSFDYMNLCWQSNIWVTQKYICILIQIT